MKLLLLLLLLRLRIVSVIVSLHRHMHLRWWTLVTLLAKEILVLRRHLRRIIYNIQRRLLLLNWRRHLLRYDWLWVILLRLPTKDIWRMSIRNTNTHYPRMDRCNCLQQILVEMLSCAIPVIVFILHQQLLIITIQQSLSLGEIFVACLRGTRSIWRFLFQSVFDFLSLISADINRIAPFAPAILTPIARQCSSSLQPWYLTQTRFASFWKCLHALSAAAILHYEVSIS